MHGSVVVIFMSALRCATHVLMHNSSISPVFVKKSLRIISPGGSGQNKVLACFAALIEFEETLLSFIQWKLGWLWMQSGSAGEK